MFNYPKFFRIENRVPKIRAGKTLFEQMCHMNRVFGFVIFSKTLTARVYHNRTIEYNMEAITKKQLKITAGFHTGME